MKSWWDELATFLRHKTSQDLSRGFLLLYNIFGFSAKAKSRGQSETPIATGEAREVQGSLARLDIYIYATPPSDLPFLAFPVSKNYVFAWKNVMFS